MSTPVSEILRMNGFSPLRMFSGLPKNARKNRNRKIRHAAQHGGAQGISALLSSTAYNEFTDPKRFGKKQGAAEQGSTRISSLPGFSASTGPTGGWGRLPNVSPIDYADDDPRGWIAVTRNKRNRACRIQDEEFA
jgi:hypothetical protein